MSASTIPLTAARIEHFTPPALKGGPKETSFHILVPTPAERDRIGSRIYELGVRSVTREQVRATLIDELYKLHDEAEADELAGFLDGFWQRQEVQNEAIERWQEQERQRILDEEEGAPSRAPAAVPARIISPRENARVELLIAEVSDGSERFRKICARQLDYGRQNAMMMARIHIRGASGGTVPALLEGDGEKLSEACIHAIRAEIGETAWFELETHVASLYALSGEEEKNSGSPPVRPPDPTGSPAPSDGSGPSDGSSTTSSTGPAPIAGSATTIAKSSGSSSDRKTRTARSGPTGEA